MESVAGGFESRLVVNGGDFVNEGTLVAGEGAGGARSLFGNLVNRGVVTLERTLDLLVAGSNHRNEGSVEVGSGAVLLVRGNGTVFEQAAGTIVGPGQTELRDGLWRQLGGTVAGPLRIQGGMLEYSGGSFGGAGPLLLNSSLQFAAGAETGRTFIFAGGGNTVTEVPAGQTVWVRGSSLAGTAVLTAPAGLTNRGTILLESIDGGFETRLEVNGGDFVNEGTLVSGEGTGGTRSFFGNMIHRGRLELARTLGLFRNGAVWRNEGEIVALSSGPRLELVNRNLVFEQVSGRVAAGTLRVQGATFEYSGGLLEGDGPELLDVMLRYGAAPSPVTLILQGGNTRLPGEIPAGQTVSLRGSSLVGTTVGTASAGLINRGTLVMESVAGGFESRLVVNGGDFVNEGALVAERGAGGARTVFGTTVNNGGVAVEQTLTLFGDLTQGSAGTLSVLLAPARPRLAVNGSATLAGALTLPLEGGFVPGLGETFRILTFQARSGGFDQTDDLDLGGGLRLDPVYDATGLTLTVVNAP
jgi:hypothetical protein